MHVGPRTVCKTTCRALLSPSFSAENTKLQQLLYFSTRAIVAILHKICSIILVQGNLRGGRMCSRPSIPASRKTPTNFSSSTIARVQKNKNWLRPVNLVISAENSN